MQILFLRKKHLFIGMITLLIIFFGIGFAFSLPQQIYRYSKLQKTVVIDAGHGSIDAGCSYGTILEKDINLQVAFMLKDLLEKSNIRVIMTRTEDVLYNKSRREDIVYRARLTNEVKADAFISIHVNKYPSAKPFGGQAYYYGGEDSKLLAQKMQEQLKLIQPNNYRSIGTGDYYVLKKTSCPATIVEIGFISNPVDRQRLTNPEEQSRIALAIRNGLVSYFYNDFETGQDLIEEIAQPTQNQNPDITSGYDLYFANPEAIGELLIPVHLPYPIEILSVDSTQNQTVLEIIAIKAIQQLIQGPKSPDHISVIPAQTRLLSLQITADLVTLNFNQALINNHWGGSEAEFATVSSIVKTITSIPGIRKVQILIEGEPGQSIAGHIIFDKPLEADNF